MRKIIFASACLAAVAGILSSGAPARAEEPSVVVTITNFAFSPAVVTIKRGQTVRWVNQDFAPHTATADGETAEGDALFDTDTIGAGRFAEKTFAQAGAFAYHCGFHRGMKATVVVQE